MLERIKGPLRPAKDDSSATAVWVLHLRRFRPTSRGGPVTVAGWFPRITALAAMWWGPKALDPGCSASLTFTGLFSKTGLL